MTFSWDFDNDGTIDTSSTGLTSVTHTYSDSGTYTILLEVTDSDGLSDSTTTTVTVTEPAPVNTAPVAIFTVTPTSGTMDTIFTFNADSSSDAEDSLSQLTFSWDFDSDGTVGITDFLQLLAAWGQCAGCPEDLDGDGTVGITDFLQLLAYWGSCPTMVQIQLQIIRTQLGRIWYCHSSDGGDTWTEAVPWTMAAPEAPSTLARTPDRSEFLLIYNPTVRLGTGHSGPRTPLVAALSTDEGRTWSQPKAIESDLSAHYAYTSIRFHKDRALLTYYVARGGLLSLKFKSIPLAWFRE